jgi:hypothetical protein
MAQHSHRFTIADDDAVRVLLSKLVGSGLKQGRREKLLRALVTTQLGTTKIRIRKCGRHSSMGC